MRYMQQASGREGVNRTFYSRNLNRSDLGTQVTIMLKPVLTELSVVILITPI